MHIEGNGEVGGRSGRGEWSRPGEMQTLHSRFEPSSPRRFLLPAILLVLAEESRHGYALVAGLDRLGLKHVQRASVYRALADLEQDGLVTSTEERRSGGLPRRVFTLTPKGVDALEQWMSVVAEERDRLEAVLAEYWYQVVRPLSRGDTRGAQLELADPSEARAEPRLRSARAKDASSLSPTRFRVMARLSRVVVEARPNIGPIAFTGLPA
jgi:PadR family transcriptional regulator PadR